VIQFRRNFGKSAALTAGFTEARGQVVVTIKPEQTDRGRSLLVINKPSWMVLDDNQPPEVRVVAVDGKPVAAQGKEGAYDLGCLARGPRSLTLRATDDKNPVAASSLWVRLGGRLLPVKPPASGQPPAKSMQFDVALSDENSAPGVYELTLGLADASPQQNEAVCRLTFSVLGAVVSPDQQQITLAGPGTEFIAKAADPNFLTVVGPNSTCYLTVDCGGWRYIQHFDSVETIASDGERRVIRARGRAYDREKQAFDDTVTLEFDFEVRRTTPALLLTSRAINHGLEREIYCFWGWLPGQGFQLAGDPKPREWRTEYRDLGVFDWAFLPPTNASQPGLGVVTPQVIGESRFNTMLFYTEPKRLKTPQDGAAEMRLALSPAKSAEEMARIRATVPKTW
jgi:hypothetical protein